MSTRLMVDPDEAAERITRQIELGKQLRSSPPPSIEALELELGKWSDFNVAVLETLFDSDEPVNEYRQVTVGRVLIRHDHAYMREFFLELLARRLAKLESLRDRVPLFELPTPKPSGTANRNEEAAAQPLALFISHSSEDVGLVEHLVDLIQRSLGLPPDRIRATSVDSYRLPGGASTNETLRRETIETEAFVGLISSRSLASIYVVFELGARWGSGRPFVPVVASDLDWATVGGPLRDINYRRCTEADLHALIGDLSAVLGISPIAPDQYQRHLERVVEADKSLKEERAGEGTSGAVSPDTTTLEVTCRPLAAKQPPGWSGAWRLSLEVMNHGPSGEFQVKLLRGVRGLDDDDYGNFLLQWDLVEDETRPIHRDDSAIVHVAWSQDRKLRFLGPTTVYGPQTFHKEVKARADVWGTIEIRDVASGRYRRTALAITFDHEHQPYLQLPDFQS